MIGNKSTCNTIWLMRMEITQKGPLVIVGQVQSYKKITGSACSGPDFSPSMKKAWLVLCTSQACNLVWEKLEHSNGHGNEKSGSAGCHTAQFS